jgi:hypothetical protein
MPALRVYGGIAFKLTCRVADMHGLFRVVVVAKHPHSARAILRRAGIAECWCLWPSGSIVEQQVSRSGRVMAAPLHGAYLRVTEYAEYQPTAKRKRKK